jgi:S-methylmethionine-dependent homocysteine/selenocysteine methylase
MNAAIEAIELSLAEERIILLDGGTGTELERRGVAMDDAAWCALATASHPDLLRSIHEDYVRLGCDVITANTFASARHMMEQSGQGERTRDLLRRAVELAREAVQRAADQPVAVAGSISTMRPVARASDQRDEKVSLAAIPWAANLREAAETMAEAGADLLLLQMITDIDHGMVALEAARATGLPVWLGLSAKRRDHRLVSFRDDGPDFLTLADHWTKQPVQAVGIMHTALPDMDESLDLLLARTQLPVMAYPESGYFRSPNWTFAALDPEGFAAAALGWGRRGARILGGCCGTGPDHIAALARHVAAEHDARTGGGKG